VLPDEREAGRTAANVLLAAGHQERIYLIGGAPPNRVPKGSLAGVERLRGIGEAFRAAGVAVAGAIACPDWQPELGYNAVRRLLENERPSALICFNDRLALGAYQALADAQLEIPADVSVVSFDDDMLASWVRPQLTTVGLPHYELGRAAIEVLLADGRNDDGEAHVVRMPMPLRERESVTSPSSSASMTLSRRRLSIDGSRPTARSARSKSS
jgi:LacI family transcriptional regulator